MNLLSFFGGQKREQAPVRGQEEDRPAQLEVYSGMRVEVTAMDGRILFVAKLLRLQGDRAELHQYMEAAIPPPEEPIPVRIRGFSDRDRKAVYMEGTIAPLPQSRWAVTGLKVHRLGNDRAFFRLTTDQPASATMFSGLTMGERPCRLLNISIGGACIGSEFRYHEGDRFLLKVRLLEDRPESVMFSQIVRVIDKGEGRFEYGCRFLELTEADQEQITRNIFDVQRQHRG